MKIVSVEYFRLDLPLAMPYTIAYEKVTGSTNIILKLETDKGTIGWGCAQPDLHVTRETPEEVISNITTFIEPMLRGNSPYQSAYYIHELKKQLKESSSTLAMVDIALYDLMARKSHLPLYQLLGGYRDKITTSITIGILPLIETVDQARYYVQKGFSILKLKGGINLFEDIEKVHKLREALGKNFILRFDANQGYDVKEAIAFVKATKNSKIQIFEQPTSQNSEQLMGEVTRNVSIPVMADESIKSLSDVYSLVKNDLINMVNIKIQKVGGIREAQHINSVSKAAQMDVMVGCMDECALGISAGLHFALSVPNVRFADLDGHLDLLEDPFTDLFTLKDGVLYPSQHAGLGKINF